MDPKTQALITALERQRNGLANLAAQGEAELVSLYEAKLAERDKRIAELEAQAPKPVDPVPAPAPNGHDTEARPN